MNWVDYVILVIVLLGAWRGYRKGFLAAFAKLASYILGFLGAVLFYKPFAEYLSKISALKAWVIQSAGQYIHLPENLQKIPIQSLSINKVQDALNTMSLPEMYKKQVAEMIQQLGVIANKADVFTISDAIHQLIAGVIIKIIAFIILILVIEVCTSLIFAIFSKLMKYSPAGFLDKGAGIILGSTRSILVVTLTLAVANPILTLGSLNKTGMIGQICTGIEGSQLSTYIVSMIHGMGIMS